MSSLLLVLFLSLVANFGLLFFLLKEVKNKKAEFGGAKILSDEHSDCQKSNDFLMVEVPMLKLQLDELLSNLSASEGQLTECKKSLELERERYPLLEQELERVSKQLSEMSAILVVSEKNSDVLKESLNHQMCANSRLSQDVSTFVAKKAEDASIIFGLREELKKSESRFHAFQKKYLSIAATFEEAVEISSQLPELMKKFDELTFEKQLLEKNYRRARTTYTRLLKDIAKLEDRLEIYSYGLYEPHFSFESSEAYKAEIHRCYEVQKEMIRNDVATVCGTDWTFNNSESQGRKAVKNYSKIMLRAFNGECDSALAKVRWNNANAMEDRILRSFEQINRLGMTHDISISLEYFQVRMEEFWLTHEYQEKIHQEKEEQRRIREQIREEERSRREIEQARAEAEKEEAFYQKALDKARRELDLKFGPDRDTLESRIKELEVSLAKAEESKERATSMAQITKSGYVYIISNIGSFGENIFKIGMTRRLEPDDRVKELSGASVPFPFDIHGMIYSENAPSLEYEFHQRFRSRRMNLVNGRKEFFNVSLNEILEVAAELNHEVKLTQAAEARDFRQSKAILEKLSDVTLEKLIRAEVATSYPEKLFAELTVQNQTDDDELDDL